MYTLLLIYLFIYNGDLALRGRPESARRGLRMIILFAPPHKRLSNLYIYRFIYLVVVIYLVVIYMFIYNGGLGLDEQEEGDHKRQDHRRP